jgi:hypothetical protein
MALSVRKNLQSSISTLGLSPAIAQPYHLRSVSAHADDYKATFGCFIEARYRRRVDAGIP